MTHGEQLRGPCSVNVCILENAGPAVLLMGLIQDAPHPPPVSPKRWVTTSSDIRCLLLWIPPEPITILLIKHKPKDKHKMLTKWLQTETYSKFYCNLLRFANIAPERWNSMIRWRHYGMNNKELVASLDWCIWFLFFLLPHTEESIL